MLRASCDRYTDSTQNSVCLDMLAKLQQSLPAKGAGAVRLHASGAALASTPYRGDSEEDDPQHQEPWYSHGPEGFNPYDSQQHEGPHAEYEPYGDSEYSSRQGPPTSYGRDPPAPSEPLIPTTDTRLVIDVTPKNANATGRLTQDDFTDWSK